MARRAIICAGDTTTHGGCVLEGESSVTIQGKPVAGAGHKVSCPQCQGVFPILPIPRRYPHGIHGRDTAVEGMRTACGAVLIASQSTNTIDDDGEADAYIDGHDNIVAAATAFPSSPPTLCHACMTTAARNAMTMIVRG
ncbi:PAAR domain-containing protein [Burkholderia gladioli]|uniref:PAAR domain-containing protein n=1 Tax=Burkholderia gladioli TaxID=28095 RepID=UPI00163EA169|nr:PAAR domain-containing protein [Burkholderia gladioli]